MNAKHTAVILSQAVRGKGSQWRRRRRLRRRPLNLCTTTTISRCGPGGPPNACPPSFAACPGGQTCQTDASGEKLLKAAVQQNYCAYSALLDDPLLKDLRKDTAFNGDGQLQRDGNIQGQ